MERWRFEIELFVCACESVLAGWLAGLVIVLFSFLLNGMRRLVRFVNGVGVDDAE